MTVTVRFAPSPTGKLHVGNIRTALLNYLFAKKHGGRFLLRLDDTDRERSTEANARGIEEDLLWLGLNWDLFAKQSARFDRYAAAVERLKTSGRLYPAYETQEELSLKRKRQLSAGKPPVYDRAALRLTAAERAALESEGRKPHWRFRLEERQVAWHDLVRGEQRVDAGSLSDPVLVREDGTYLYTLPSVVDDIELGISHVIRGEDHVANTAAQIQIFEALGAPPPQFGHHNLLVGPQGEALSKRLGSLSIAAFREEGLEPEGIASYAATVGSAETIAVHRSLDDLIGGFDLGKISRAPARFDPAELRALNAKLLHERSYAEVAERLVALGIEGGAVFWETVRGNIAVLKDAALWWNIVSAPITPVVEDRVVIEAAARLLPPDPIDEAAAEAWLTAVKRETGAKGRSLFQPLRMALTGLDHGPELKRLLPLLGQERAEARLRGMRG